jgi:hypothetical protein
MNASGQSWLAPSIRLAAPSISAATSRDRYTERLKPSTVLGDSKDGFGKDKKIRQ